MNQDSSKYPLSCKSLQVKTFVFLFGIIVLAAGCLNYWDDTLFQRFIGEINPILAIIFSGLIGFFLILYFLSKAWFIVHRWGALKKAFYFSWVIVVFASVAILIDLFIGFPGDINIPFPKSLLFYPVIAFFVEMLFHVSPLVIVLGLLPYFFKKVEEAKIIWMSIILVAILEPTYQAFFMDTHPVWSIIVTWINLFLFNVTQLVIFKNFGFISMYLYRLVYYMIWHIVWGHFRLEILF